MTESPATDRSQDDGVGWWPAIIAGSLLLAAFGFVCCGVSTYVLFQKRTELAARTLQGHTIPTVEQSQLPPEEKRQINQILSQVVADAESGRLENWQASGVMNRLTRIPLLEWGDLTAVEELIASHDGFDPQQQADAKQQLSRLRQAIQKDLASIFDVDSVLAPVLVEDQSLRGQRLRSNISKELLAEVVLRAQLIADRCKIEDRMFAQPSIVEIVRSAVSAGTTAGAM